MLNNGYENKAVRHWFHFIKEKLLYEREISLPIATDSMRPLINPQDRVVVKQCRADDLKLGDIVLFEKSSAFCVHRFVEKRVYEKESELLTMADRALMPEEAFSEEQLLGRVESIIKKSVTIDLEKPLGRALNRFFYFFVFLKIYAYKSAVRLKRTLKHGLRNEDILIRLCSTTSIDNRSQTTIRRILSQHVDWDYFLKQLKKEDTAPLLYKSLLDIEDMKARIPGHVQGFLKNFYYSVLARNISISGSLEKNYASFKEEGIDAILFKGIMLAESVYRDIGLRPMGDIDLLIRKEDMAKADGILRRNGYTMPIRVNDFIGNSSGQYRNSFLYQSDKHFPDAVHLHWHVVNFSPYDDGIVKKIDLNRVWQESAVMRLGRAEVRAFSLHHQIIFLCMHALNHSFYPLLRLCDINELIRLEKDRIDWNRLAEDACAFHLSKSVYYVFYLVSVMFNTQVPAHILGKLKPERIGFIERRFISAVLHGSPILTGEWLMCFGMNEKLRDKILFLKRLLFPPKKELALIRKKGASTVGVLDYQRRLTAGITCAVKVMFHFARQMPSRM
jgi:hypothetical protein